MKRSWYIFLAFFAALWSKNLLFNGFVFAAAMPWGFWQYFVAQLCAAVFVASFVLISRRPWWTIAALVIVDIWGLANWLYFQSYGLFVSFSMLGIAGNLHGYTDSIRAFIDWRIPVFIAPTLLYTLALYFLPHRQERHAGAFAGMFGLGIILIMLNNILIHVGRAQDGYCDGPLTFRKTLPLYIDEKRMLDDWESSYSLMRNHSLIGYMPLHVVYEHKMVQYRMVCQDTFTEQEQEWISALTNVPTAPLTPNSHLVFILVESLESWALYYPGITLRMNALRNDPHAFFADKLVSEKRHGMSADGQLIVNTGLLPLQTGVASVLYGTNTYPNFAHLYPRSIVINPSKGTWNKNVTMPAYGYREMIEPESVSEQTWWNDEQVCDKAAAWMAQSDSLSCAFVLTISSHAPFEKVSGMTAAVTDDTPYLMGKYLNCMHYTDSCIGALLDQLTEQGKMEHTTVVITSDHAFFHSTRRHPLVSYAQRHDLPITQDDQYVPLIIYSPHSASPVEVSERCYQMDTYSTVLHAIGCDAYTWRGCGVNLFDEDARQHRLLTEEEAYKLSDKLIRNNWFEAHKPH